MSTDMDCKTRVIRVKRKANEERVMPNKRCKFVGTCHSPDRQLIHQLLNTSTTLVTHKADNECLQITDYDDLMANDDNNVGANNSTQSTEKITCNGEPLQVVDNKDFEYIYDIYVYEKEERFDDDRDSDDRHIDDEEDSNDENYVFNDYPDERDLRDRFLPCDDSDYEDEQNLYNYEEETHLRHKFDKFVLSDDSDYD